MELKLYQVDAFASEVFKGNPAAICPLENWLSDSLMQQIAAENNLSETAFFVATDDGFHIRWFTPNTEVDLCGHATLASAHVIFNQLAYQAEKIKFDSKSGPLYVEKCEKGLQLDFPNQQADACDTPRAITAIFGREPIACFKNQDYIVVFDDEEFVKHVQPDFNALKQLDLRGVNITSSSKEYDFVSRFFAPKFGIDEDPVTGSSFTRLAPYWAKQLNKKSLYAKQVSQRGGEVHCEIHGDRVLISGQTVLYMVASIYL